jgi:hypothetical protein
MFFIRKIAIGTLIVALAAGTFYFFHGARVSAQTSAPANSAAKVVKDSAGMCQMTIPDSWRPAKSGVSWADGPGGNGPEGARAHLQAEKSTDSWEAQKKSIMDRSRGETILYDDANRLLFDYTGLNDRGFTLTAARRAKGYFCWVSIDSSALHAKAKFGADFRAIADSIKPVQ